MIVIKETQRVDEDIEPYLTEVSHKDYLDFGSDALAFMNKSYKRWFIFIDNNPIALAGLYKKSLIGKPELWLLLFNTFRIHSGARAVEIAANLLRAHHPDAFMRVHNDFKAGHHFAEWLGFNTQSQEGDYAIYEVTP